VTLPLPWFVQSRSPALADIIGARRVTSILFGPKNGRPRNMLCNTAPFGRPNRRRKG
jgi:hypothetical protein